MCTDYCTNDKNKNWCVSGKGKYCGTTNIETPRCQTWCMENSGSCDPGMRSFCKKYPLNDTCTCMNSKVAKYNPLCVDTKCAQSGYATTNIKEAKGKSCNIIDCSQHTDIQKAVAGKNVSVALTYEQNCGSTTLKPSEEQKTDTVLDTDKETNDTKIDTISDTKTDTVLDTKKDTKDTKTDTVLDTKKDTKDTKTDTTPETTKDSELDLVNDSKMDKKKSEDENNKEKKKKEDDRKRTIILIIFVVFFVIMIIIGLVIGFAGNKKQKQNINKV